MDPTGSGAIVAANVAGGAVTSYTVDISGGENYTNPTILVQPTALMLNRPYPSDADSGTYSSYAINAGKRPGQSCFAPSMRSLPAATGESMWGTTGCESETAVYLNPTTVGKLVCIGPRHSRARWDLAKRLSIQRHRFQWLDQWKFHGRDQLLRGVTGQPGPVLSFRPDIGAQCRQRTIDDYLIKSPWGNRDVSGGSILLGGRAGNRRLRVGHF